MPGTISTAFSCNCPCPGRWTPKRVLLAVDPAKDVDGFHPLNVGYLSTGRPGLVPCTPCGVIEILRRSQIPIEGQEAVVVGRSDIVGKPVAMLLTNANATVTVCHSRTRDLPAVCRRGDILIAAIGKTGMITPEFVKPGATVIDVGINRITDRAEFEKYFAGDAKREADFAAKGSTLIGDVHPQGRRGGRRAHSRARRRWSADDCHADGEHRQGRRDAPGRAPRDSRQRY